MTAAVYARKSTDQTGVADEQKSVARQIDHARAYAARKGWTIDDAHVYIDDGISGAEFANRPGFLRLMNALKPRPQFQVLVMSEESRLGREAIETAYALKQLVTAGVRVFFYLEDRERTLDSPTDKIMLSLTAFADELEREKARQRTRDAMVRKAKAGHVTGGACFGYRNVEIVGPDGKRSHVDRQIDPTEAEVMRRIFRLSAEGYGLKTIAKRLNADDVPSPRAQRGRSQTWAPTLYPCVATGGHLDGLLSALQERETRRVTLEARREALCSERRLRASDLARAREELIALAASWRRVLSDDPTHARPIVASLLKGRVTFAPLESHRWRVSGKGSLIGLFSREVAGRGIVPNRIGNTGTGRRTVVGGGVEDTTGWTMVNLSAVRHQALSALRRIRARSVVAARPRVMSVIVEGSGTGAKS
jgi:DNA invertase Pin-like site-specific DNA recombinase